MQKAYAFRNINLIRPDLLHKILSFNPDTANMFIERFNNGTLTSEFVNNLRYEIRKEDISRYSSPGLNFTVSFNHDHDWVSGTQRDFTRVVAHEFKHAQYFVGSFYEVLKWKLIRQECVNGSVNLVDFKDGLNDVGSDCQGCSRGYGHERYNPENCEVCAEQNKYN